MQGRTDDRVRGGAAYIVGPDAGTRRSQGVGKASFQLASGREQHTLRATPRRTNSSPLDSRQVPRRSAHDRGEGFAASGIDVSAAALVLAVFGRECGTIFAQVPQDFPACRYGCDVPPVHLAP